MRSKHTPVNLSPFFLCLFSFFLGAPAVLSFAPYHFWYVIFISLTGLLYLLYKQSPKQSALIGFFWGFGYFGFGIRWVYISLNIYGNMPFFVNYLLMGLLFVYLALFPALFAWLFNRPRTLKDGIRYCIWGPLVWLFIEWFRGFMFTGFPWLELGYSQLQSPLSHFAPLVAVDGITFLIIFICGFFVRYSQKQQIIYLVPMIVITSTTLLLQRINWVTPSERPPVKVALIQENVDQVKKFDPNYIEPTILGYLRASDNYWNADLIIWPETAIPAPELSVSSYIDLIHDTAYEHNTAILAGIINYQQMDIYNSVIALGKGQPQNYRLGGTQRYNKYHLLPFGEFVPFEKYLRKIAPIFNLPYSSFSQGEKLQANMTANGYNIAPAICFEILFNEEVRRNVTPLTDILLTVSNDSWFGDSDGPRQHLQIAQMRALELGKPLIRSTNSGISALIDSKGQIIKELGVMQKGSFMAELPLTNGSTPYYSWGKKPLYILLALFALIALISKKNYRSL